MKNMTINASAMKLKRRKKIRKNLIYIPLVFFAIIALLPLYYLIITAFKSLDEASTQATMWPQTFELFKNIKFVISHPEYNIGRMFLNTMFIFVLKALGTTITCSLVAYGFAMYKFPKKNIIFFVLLSTMMIPGELLNIPLWIATWFATDVFIIFLFRQFFLGMKKELIEAARIDGYNEFQIFFKIVMPINKNVFATVIILYFIGTYNDLYGPALYITKQQNRVMANSISIFENLYSSGSSSFLVPWNYVSVAALIGMIPEILLFIVMQKTFMESVSGVEVKG